MKSHFNKIDICYVYIVWYTLQCKGFNPYLQFKYYSTVLFYKLNSIIFENTVKK